MSNGIHACDVCGGPISPVFYVVKFSQALINQAAVARHIGLLYLFNHNRKLAETFSPDTAMEVLVDGVDANEWKEGVICQTCFMDSRVLATIFDRKEEANADG